MTLSARNQARGLARDAFRQFGLDVRRADRADPGLMDFLRSRDVDVVLDVGANEGQFGQKLRRLGYAGRIVSFEPLLAMFARLKGHADADGRWDCHHCALGGADGEAAINVSEDTAFSSILPQSPQARVFDNRAAVSRTEVVTVRRLDGLGEAVGGSRVFLKIDTQGFEREVLAGATSVLPRVAGLQLELPVVHLYEGAWSMAEALARLAELGFVLAQVAPVNHRRNDPVSLLEIDGVFRRRDEGDAAPG